MFAGLHRPTVHSTCRRQSQSVQQTPRNRWANPPFPRTSPIEPGPPVLESPRKSDAALVPALWSPASSVRLFFSFLSGEYSLSLHTPVLPRSTSASSCRIGPCGSSHVVARPRPAKKNDQDRRGRKSATPAPPEHGEPRGARFEPLTSRAAFTRLDGYLSIDAAPRCATYSRRALASSPRCPPSPP